METFHITDSKYYDRYESLILQRDALEAEAEQYWISYLKIFGKLTVELFELKVDCIELKKKIAFYQTAKNLNKTVTDDELKEYMDEHMAAYRCQLEDIKGQAELAKKAGAISPYEAEQVKKIYRKLARTLHPDISPLGEQEKYADFFQEIINAYKANDLKRLQELEVLVNASLREDGIDTFEMVIDDLDEKIEGLESEIAGILESDGFKYKELLSDPAKIEEETQKLQDETETYKQYKTELEGILAGLINH